MAKKIVGYIKLQVPAGKANPSPPIGPALGQRGLNIMEFCKAFNAQTSSMEPGLVLPVVITAFADKSFTFILKTPPATVLIKKALKLDKGSPKPQVLLAERIERHHAADNQQRGDRELGFVSAGGNGFDCGWVRHVCSLFQSNEANIPKGCTTSDSKARKHF